MLTKKLKLTNTRFHPSFFHSSSRHKSVFTPPANAGLLLLFMLSLPEKTAAKLFSFLANNTHYIFEKSDNRGSVYSKTVNAFYDNIIDLLRGPLFKNVTETNLIPTNTMTAWKNELCQETFSLLRDTFEQEQQDFQTTFISVTTPLSTYYQDQCNKFDEDMSRQLSIVAFAFLSLAILFACLVLGIFLNSICKRSQYQAIPDPVKNDEKSIVRITQDNLSIDDDLILNQTELSDIETPTYQSSI